MSHNGLFDASGAVFNERNAMKAGRQHGHAPCMTQNQRAMVVFGHENILKNDHGGLKTRDNGRKMIENPCDSIG